MITWIINLLKSWLLGDAKIKAIEEQAYQRGKADATVEQKTAEIKAAEIGKDVDNSVNQLDDSAVRKRLHDKYTRDF